MPGSADAWFSLVQPIEVIYDEEVARYIEGVFLGPIPQHADEASALLADLRAAVRLQATGCVGKSDPVA